MQNNTLAQIESFVWLSQPLLKHVRKILKFSIICFYSSEWEQTGLKLLTQQEKLQY